MILIFTMMSIVAAILVSRGKSLAANAIWAVSNLGIICHNVSIGEYEMVTLFSAYAIIAIYGVWNLSRGRKKDGALR